MKIYLLSTKVYNYAKDELEDEYSEVFSSFERAKEYGLEFVNKNLSYYCKNKNKSIEQCIKDEKVDFDFRIIEEDIEYAEKFDKQIDYFFAEIEDYLVYEPTHKKYILDYKGNVTDICLMYLPNQKEVLSYNHLYMKPGDLDKDAGTKFKVGDIVKLAKTKARYLDDYTYHDYGATYSELYVVRYLPRRVEGQKYLRNTYALAEILDEDYAPGVYTKEFHEEQIAKYEGEVEENSPLDILRRIFTNQLEVDDETWSKLKYGMISFREQDKNNSNYYKKRLKLEDNR